VFPAEALLPTVLITLAFLFLESRSRVSMFPARPPVRASRGHRLLQSRTDGFGRLPKLSTLKPPHLRIGLPFFQSAQRREQVFAISRAERGRQPAREDCPVRESWWHRSLLFESLEFLDKRGPLDVQKFRSPVAIPAGYIQR